MRIFYIYEVRGGESCQHKRGRESPKPPLCKGRWPLEKRPEGLFVWMLAIHRAVIGGSLQSPSPASRDSPLYTRGPLIYDNRLSSPSPFETFRLFAVLFRTTHLSSPSPFETFRLFAVFFERCASHLLLHINFSKGVTRTDLRSSKSKALAKMPGLKMDFAEVKSLFPL